MEVDDVLDPEALTALVDYRSEEPHIEYKSWVDLSGNDARAKIAKHLCAIANYGGGSLVFGINDDGSHSKPRPTDLKLYGQDSINSIVEKYLAPSFHCRVVDVPSLRDGLIFPVVRIPSHGATPIAAKRDGPSVPGTSKGISRGVHYIRVPGPRSVPIDSPELWRGVIHRCVVNERINLLNSIARLFEHPRKVAKNTHNMHWFDEGISEWDKLQQSHGWSVDPRKHRSAFGFRLLDSLGGPVQPLPLPALKAAIDKCALAEEAQVNFGFVFFAQAAADPKRPTVALDRDVEGYQANMIMIGDKYAVSPAFWRLLADGRGVEVRTYHEDSSWVAGVVEQRSMGTREWRAGQYFCPRFQAGRSLQFLVFVREFAEYYQDAALIEITLDYVGLKGRSLEDPDPRIGLWQRSSSIDARRRSVEFDPEVLAGDRIANGAKEIIDPFLRLYDGYAMELSAIEALLRSD